MLSEQEDALFRILNEVAHQGGSTTTLRVAGGWVRDKVLAAQSCGPKMLGGLDGGDDKDENEAEAHTKAGQHMDIDVALDDQLGVAFAAKVNAWLVAQGEEGANVGTILANPDKSKHLETATMSLRGFSVDFVNLRTEVCVPYRVWHLAELPTRYARWLD